MQCLAWICLKTYLKNNIQSPFSQFPTNTIFGHPAFLAICGATKARTPPLPCPTWTLGRDVGDLGTCIGQWCFWMFLYVSGCFWFPADHFPLFLWKALSIASSHAVDYNIAWSFIRVHIVCEQASHASCIAISTSQIPSCPDRLYATTSIQSIPKAFTRISASAGSCNFEIYYRSVEEYVSLALILMRGRSISTNLLQDAECLTLPSQRYQSRTTICVHSHPHLSHLYVYTYIYIYMYYIVYIYVYIYIHIYIWGLSKIPFPGQPSIAQPIA